MIEGIISLQWLMCMSLVVVPTMTSVRPPLFAGASVAVIIFPTRPMLAIPAWYLGSVWVS